MKPMIAWIGILAIGMAVPAYAHTSHKESSEDVKDWVDRYFDEVDTDGNGYITKEEFLDHAQKKFDAMDANHDGQLSKQEVIHYKMEEQAEWRRTHPTGGKHKPDETTDDKDRPDVNEDDKTNSGNTSDK